MHLKDICIAVCGANLNHTREEASRNGNCIALSMSCGVAIPNLEKSAFESYDPCPCNLSLKYLRRRPLLLAANYTMALKYTPLEDLQSV
jgi:hypothetical protein